MRARPRVLTFLIALLALFVAAPAFAQNKTVDAAMERARTAMVSDPDEGLKLVGQAERLALAMPAGRDRTIALATVKWLRSEGYLRLNDVAKARPLIAQALADIAPIREPIKLRGDLLLSLGSLQMDDGQAAQPEAIPAAASSSISASWVVPSSSAK